MTLRAKLKAAVEPLRSLFGSDSGGMTRPVRGGITGWLGEPYAGAWQQGVQPEPLGALTAYGAVYASVSRITNDIAKLEARLLEEQKSGIWTPVTSLSPYWKTLKRPNSYQNRIQFTAYWLTCKLLFGNAYVVKARDARGVVAALYLVDPRRVVPLVTPEGDVYYSIGGDNLTRMPGGMTVPASEVIHDRINCLWHPLVGVSPLYACAISATQGLRIQQNSAAFFTNMSRPSGMLTGPGTIEAPTAERLKSEWQANFTGQNFGKLAVLGDGLKYEAMTIPAEQAQLIEQLQWTVEDVARAFCLPLYKIGAGTMPTNNNVESLNQQYYSDCLQPHIESIELLLDEGLGVPAGQRVEFDLSGLFRMDQTAQITVLEKAVTGTILTPNEARAKLNYEPKPGGDALYKQQQNYSLEALAKRDAKDDPFGKDDPTPAPAPAPQAAPAPEAEPETDAVDAEAKDWTVHYILEGIQCEQI